MSSSAASDVSLAPVGSRIIRAMQPSATRGETAECVALQWRRPGEHANKSRRAERRPRTLGSGRRQSRDRAGPDDRDRVALRSRTGAGGQLLWRHSDRAVRGVPSVEAIVRDVRAFRALGHLDGAAAEYLCMAEAGIANAMPESALTGEHLPGDGRCWPGCLTP